MTVAGRILALAILLPASGAALELDWSESPAIPGRDSLEGAQLCVVDGRLVLAGGLDARTGATLADAWILDGPEGAWRRTTDLPVATAFAAAASAGGRCALVGGISGPGDQPTGSALEIRLAGDDLAYEALPELSIPTARGAAAWLEGVLYYAGGASGAQAPTGGTALWALDLETGQPQWESRAPLGGPVRHSGSLAAVDGALVIIGGAPATGGVAIPPLADAHRYTEAGGWSPLATAPEALVPGSAVPFGFTHVSAMTASGGLLAYHSVTDTWVATGDSPGPLGLAGAVEWGGRVVLAGADADGRPRLLAMEVRPDPSGFHSIDYVTLTAYFLVLVTMGLYFARVGTSSEDFFVAGRRMPWWATGLSIFGTQLSSISFMAIPAKVYATDWVYFLLQMTIIMVAFPVVFCYLPHFRRTPMTSAYEYLERRFNLQVRMYASVSFVLYQLGRMAIVLFLPAIALSTVTGISVYACILIMGVLSTLYTVIGGIRAVIWTDVVQVFVLYGGALLSLAILVSRIDGGFGAILTAGAEYDKFHMFNWTWDATTTAVWVVVVGNFFLNLVPYTSDQAVVQRYFTTRDEKAAARSIWTNAVLLLPSTLTLFLLGTGLWAFYRANPGLLDPTQPTDSIFPLFIAQQLPAGVAGLLIAAIFAASMSTLDSSLNSVSAALVTDFYARFRPQSSDSKRLWLARALTALLGAVATATSIALATFDIGSLWDTFQGMMGLLGGGLAGLFALGVFFPSANGRGAMTGAVASVAILYWVQQHTDLHFFMYGAVGILSCVGIALLASPAYARARA